MQEYEITYLVANEEVLAKKSVEKAVEEAGGKIEKVTPWGQRNLAYPIGKIHTAFYRTVNISIDTSSIKKLNRLLGLDTDIIRYLIVRGLHELEPEERKEAKTEAKKQEKIIDKPVKEVTETKKPEKKLEKVKKNQKVDVDAKEVKPKAAKKAKKDAEKTSTLKTKKTSNKPKKQDKSDDERLKQLENKLQDLLKE